MAVGKTASFALVLWLVFGAEIARGWGEDMEKDLKEFSEEHKLDEKAESVKQGASEAYGQAKDKADSWSDWAYDKMGFGKNEQVKETTHFVVDKTAEAANMADSGDMRLTTKETSEDGKEKAAEAGVNSKSKSENVTEAAAEKAGDMRVKAKETVESGKEKAGEAAVNSKSKTENVVGAAAEKAGDMKVKAGETVESGKEKAAAEEKVAAAAAAAKVKGQPAKEMASKAVGDIGAAMREKKAEL